MVYNVSRFIRVVRFIYLKINPSPPLPKFRSKYATAGDNGEPTGKIIANEVIR